MCRQSLADESSFIMARLIRTDGTSELFEYDPSDSGSLDLLKEKVGGWLEAAPVSDPRLTMYCNEEGKIQGLPPNSVATMYLAEGNPDVIVGDVVLVGAPNYHGYDTSLPEDYRLVLARADGE